MKRELITHEDPKSPVSEIFRTLRTNIQFMNSNKRMKTLLVTSTLPGEGKSWVSSNLAITFAQAGKKVILIDADMRKGRLYNVFGVLPRPGLSNYLSGVSENNQGTNDLMNYLRETEVPNLYLMPAGNIPPNPSELLITPQMIQLLEELKRECDLIIIDGTPSKLVTDSVILSRIVDSTIIVTAHNQTKKDDLEKVVRDIKNVGGNVAGVVYNKKTISAKKYNETYYYSSVPQKTPVTSKTEIEDEPKREIHKNKTISNAPYRERKQENSNMQYRERKQESSNIQYREIKQENFNKERANMLDDELPKAMRRDYTQNEQVKREQNVAEQTTKELAEIREVAKEQPVERLKTPEEKTAEVLREFNEYLKKEKRMSSKK